MSKRNLSFYLVDIFIAIDKVKRYTAPFKNAETLLFSELHTGMLQFENSKS